MAFAAIFVPNFKIQAIVRSEPELIIRPLALIDGPAPTYPVIAINRLAEHLGVAEGMTKAAAAHFPGVEIRPRGKTQEIAAHSALLDVAWSFSPRVEDTAADALVMDIDGLAALFGSHENIAANLIGKCAEIGLTVQVGVSANVETARVVSRALPGETVVPANQEAKFLATLPVNMLSLSQELFEILERWGVRTCKDLASLPVLALSECVGQEGVRQHAIASGKGTRSLVIAEPTYCFEECLELDDAVEELEPLSFLLGRLLDQVCARIVARSLAVRLIQLHFELQPSFEDAFDTARELLRARQLPGSYECTLELPVPCRDAKLLLKLLRLRLQSTLPKAPIQKIRLIAEPARTRVTQGGLFVPEVPDPEKLELTIARIANVVGEGNVGSPLPVDSHRPDSFRMQKFSIPSISPQTPAEKSEIPYGFRAFRPPLLAKVKMQEGRPVSATFKDRSGQVVHASGPWRTSGDWWEDDPWQHDAWDLELSFTRETPPSQGFYRICFDCRQKRWFVRGTYD
jgi:protein ImuB